MTMIVESAIRTLKAKRETLKQERSIQLMNVQCPVLTYMVHQKITEKLAEEIDRIEETLHRRLRNFGWDGGYTIRIRSKKGLFDIPKYSELEYLQNKGCGYLVINDSETAWFAIDTILKLAEKTRHVRWIKGVLIPE